MTGDLFRADRAMSVSTAGADARAEFFDRPAHDWRSAAAVLKRQRPPSRSAVVDARPIKRVAVRLPAGYVSGTKMADLFVSDDPLRGAVGVDGGCRIVRT